MRSDVAHSSNLRLFKQLGTESSQPPSIPSEEQCDSDPQQAARDNMMEDSRYQSFTSVQEPQLETSEEQTGELIEACSNTDTESDTQDDSQGDSVQSVNSQSDSDESEGEETGDNNVVDRSRVDPNMSVKTKRPQRARRPPDHYGELVVSCLCGFLSLWFRR